MTLLPGSGCAGRRQLRASSEPSGTAAASSNVSPAGFGAITPRSAHGDVLRIRAALDSEDLVADSELGHGRPDVLHATGELRAGDRPPRAADAGEDTSKSVLGAAHTHRVAAGDRRRGDLDEQ